MNKKLLAYLKIWVFPVAFLASVTAVFVVWGEKQLREPGGADDIRFMEQLFSSAKKAGDISFFSDYFLHRTAEILVQPSRDPEALLLFEFVNHVLRESDPERDISDLKYAAAVYKKQLMLAMPSVLKMYLAVRENFNFIGSVSLGNERMTDLESRVEMLRNLKSSDGSGHSAEEYEALLARPDFFKIRSLIMMKLAYLFYETNRQMSFKWIREARRSGPSSAAQFALGYLEKKLKKSESSSIQSAKNNESEARVLQSFSGGNLRETKQSLQSADQALNSIRMQEIKSWLEVPQEKADEEIEPFFSVYFQALRGREHGPVAVADDLAQMAADRNWSVYSSFLRYQAWGLAFFDAQDFSRAVLFKDFLKTYDPLSLFSQLESMGGTFRFSFKEYAGEELEKMWEKTPHLFEKQRVNQWAGFKSNKRRVAQTIVYRGQVYVINYDNSDTAQKMSILGMNQMESDKKPEISAEEKKSNEQTQKMSWIDRFFYEYMVQFIPDGVRSFKEQIAKLSLRLKEPVFTRFYSELEFQQYVLSRLQSSSRGTIKEIQARIDEQGFSIFAVFDLKLTAVPVRGLGKLVTSGEGGQLLLDLDHVKVSGVPLPNWILEKVEQSFNRITGMGYAAGAEHLEILDMKYQAGGIQIKCRNLNVQGTGGEKVIEV